MMIYDGACRDILWITVFSNYYSQLQATMTSYMQLAVHNRDGMSKWTRY